MRLIIFGAEIGCEVNRCAAPLFQAGASSSSVSELFSGVCRDIVPLWPFFATWPFVYFLGAIQPEK
jgi:hypothetical protein